VDGRLPTTPRLRLRRARPEDAEALHRIMADPEAMRFWDTPPHPDLATTRRFLRHMIEGAPETTDEFVVERDGALIGKAGAWRLPEIGFILARDQWGRGLGAEAVGALVDHLFATRDLPALTAEADPRNLGSLRLLARLGFRETGRAERTLEVAGVWVDSVRLALTRADRAAAARCAPGLGSPPPPG
jgi:[ribosomal protein S5]-alanine N-acetyltransferase